MSNNKNKATTKDVSQQTQGQASDTNKKLPDDPKASQEDYSVSTADNSAGGKYSKTNTRKEDKDPSNRQSS